MWVAGYLGTMFTVSLPQRNSPFSIPVQEGRCAVLARVYQFSGLEAERQVVIAIVWTGALSAHFALPHNSKLVPLSTD